MEETNLYWSHLGFLSKYDLGVHLGLSAVFNTEPFDQSNVGRQNNPVNISLSKH